MRRNKSMSYNLQYDVGLWASYFWNIPLVCNSLIHLQSYCFNDICMFFLSPQDTSRKSWKLCLLNLKWIKSNQYYYKHLYGIVFFKIIKSVIGSEGGHADLVWCWMQHWSVSIQLYCIVTHPFFLVLVLDVVFILFWVCRFAVHFNAWTSVLFIVHGTNQKRQLVFVFLQSLEKSMYCSLSCCVWRLLLWAWILARCHPRVQWLAVVCWAGWPEHSSFTLFGRDWWQLVTRENTTYLFWSHPSNQIRGETSILLTDCGNQLVFFRFWYVRPTTNKKVLSSPCCMQSFITEYKSIVCDSFCYCYPVFPHRCLW